MSLVRFRPSPMPHRDQNSQVIDMNFSLLAQLTADAVAEGIRLVLEPQSASQFPNLSVAGQINVNGATPAIGYRINVRQGNIAATRLLGGGGHIVSFGLGAPGSANYESLDLWHDGVTANIQVNKLGTGVHRPLYFKIGGSDALVIGIDQSTSAMGDLKISTIGKGLYLKEGANATGGVATLVAGSSVVSTNKVTANSRIQLTGNSDGGTPGWVRVSTRTAGTSFTITSSSATDTSTVAWTIVEPA